METIELEIDTAQKEKLQQLLAADDEPVENYRIMAQILLNQAIEDA